MTSPAGLVRAPLCWPPLLYSWPQVYGHSPLFAVRSSLSPAFRSPCCEVTKRPRPKALSTERELSPSLSRSSFELELSLALPSHHSARPNFCLLCSQPTNQPIAAHSQPLTSFAQTARPVALAKSNMKPPTITRLDCLLDWHSSAYYPS